MENFNTDLTRITKAVDKQSVMLVNSLETGFRKMDHLEKRIGELVEITESNGTRLAEIISERKEKPCFIVYHAKDDDTLWEIAQDLYGSGIFYPILLEHNPDLRVYNISSRDKIRYLCDKTLVAGIYKAIVGRKQNRLYWKYTVRAGDTQKALIKRYCLNQKECLVKDISLEPGIKIGIFLE